MLSNPTVLVLIITSNLLICGQTKSLMLLQHRCCTSFMNQHNTCWLSYVRWQIILCDNLLKLFIVGMLSLDSRISGLLIEKALVSEWEVEVSNSVFGGSNQLLHKFDLCHHGYVESGESTNLGYWSKSPWFLRGE